MAGKSPLKKLEDFFAQFQAIRYKKGETIVHAYDTPPGVFYLKNGYVRIYSISEEGKELTLIIFKPEDFFPITWAISGLPNTYSSEAITQTLVFRAPKANFQTFIKRNPDVFYELTTRMLVRLRGLMTRMEYMTFGSAYQKVASILAICAERFSRRKGKNIIIQVPLGHKDIANLIGLTRETTSIEMKKLENKKIIEHDNHLLVIKNLKKLKEEARLSTY